MPKPAQPSDAIRRVEIPMQTREAPISAVDSAARTVNLTWTTGAPVQRMDWWTGTRYEESLEVDDKACDLTRLNAGAPFLNAHNAYDLAGIIGVVERAWIENGQGKAQVRFPSPGTNVIADQIFAQVDQRIIRNVSVGYQVRKYEITRDEDTGVESRRAVDWQPMEISLVPVPADAGAGVRSAAKLFACELTERAAPASPKETVMTEEEKRAAEAKAAADAKLAEETRAAAEAKAASEAKAAADAKAAAEAQTRAAQNPDHAKMIADAIAADRQRSVAIRKRAKEAGLPQDVADDLIARGVSEEHVGNHLLEEMAKRGTKPAFGVAHTPRGALDAVETVRGGVGEALLHRISPATYKMTDRAREWRGMTLREISRGVLEANGESCRGMAPLEIATRALQSTSDFPNILAAVANKELLRGYDVETRTFLPFGVQHNAVDFKNINSIQMGEGSNLELVAENGEFKRGKFTDSAETWKLATYGKIFSLTRQAIINDDLSAFSRLPYMFGAAGVRLENDIVWAILTANANMADGNALFSTAHINNQTGGGSVLAASALSKMRQQFRQQIGIDKTQTLNLQMKSIAVPAALETTLEQLMASTQIYAAAAANVVPKFISALQPIVEARLDANSTTAFYGFADPAQRPSLEYGYLEGQDGVYLEQRIGFDVDGIEWKARHDFGAKAVDWRGMQRSVGA